MKQKGRAKDNALLRTIANKRDQNFATRRILRDLKEIEQETIPTVGVVARPLDNNLFIWHANIAGPVGTIYEGAVLHLSINLPESYPHQPPKVKLFTPVPHPNIFNDFICLDLLNPARENSQGWSSGYSIQSILIQLQSFLFEDANPEDEKAYKAKVKKAINEANQFKCTQCKHGGKLSAYPPFNKNEVKEDAFQIIEYDEDEFFANELVCYHTKQTFKTNKEEQKKENQDENQQKWKGVCLGVGLTVTKVPRTGAIQQACTTLDYISIKAFIKEGIRWSCNNERFTNWLPLYFGKNDNKERALHLGKKALSFIMTNSTRRFKPEFVLEVFTKIILTLVYMMAEQKRHISILLIRQLVHIHANFLMYMEEYPELYEIVEKRLQSFINDETFRTKDNTPNLSVIMTYLLVSPKTNFGDVIDAYHSESLDRQVFWILKAVPELVEDKNIQGLDADRADLTFKCQITSYQMLAIFKHYITTVKSQGQSPKQLYELFDNHYCKLPNRIENEIQKGAFRVRDTVDSFDNFYSFLGMKVKTLDELNEQLLQAIKNSAAKKYHGDINNIHTLPTSDCQVKALLAKIPNLQDFYTCKTIKIEGSKDFKYEIKPIRDFNQDEWKIACVKRWAWISESLRINKNLSATDIAQMSIDFFKYGDQSDQQKQNNKLYQDIEKYQRKKDIPQEKPSIRIPEHTWQQVFVKLDLEDSLIFFDKNPDFTTFYQKLEIAKQYVSCLTIPVYNVQNLKSGYHFLTQVLGRLTNIKFLEISGLPEVNINNLCMKAIKSINKGFNNFIANGGSLQCISFNNFNANGSDVEITDKLFSPLLQMKEFISLRFTKTNILQKQNAAKSLGKLITEVKSIEELVFTENVFTQQQQAKEIADALMRAKKLRYVNISRNNSVGFQGLASIIYNLAFATNLYYLDISRCNPSSNGSINDVVEALFKLIKINASLEILDSSYISNLNPNLSKDFFIHLGDIATLKSLNLEGSGIFNNSVLTHFGKAIAFNASKGGVLHYINFKKTFNSSSNLTTLYNNMQISDYDNEIWYGDPIKAGKMTKTDFDKKFYNNLKALEFDQCSNIYSGFNINDFKKYDRKDPEIMRLYARSPQLQTLLLSSCNLYKNDADLFTYALDPRRKEFASQIKVLNLSKNNLSKEGAKIFAKIFQYNNILEVVDLSKNQIGVSGAQEIALNLTNNKGVKFLNLFNNKIGYDGAKAFSQTLEKNTTLEFLELGHNRIRNKGLLAIGDGIAKNKNTGIKSLGLRFNFLNEDGVNEFFKTVKNVQSLQELFIKNNSINEYGLFQVKKVYDNLTSFNATVDIFDKLRYLDEDKLERTVFVHPVVTDRIELKRFFEETQKCGIVIDIRIRRGPKWPNRTQQENKFAMVEFADTTSTTRALTVASRKRSVYQGQKFRIYKAGTGTFIYCKKTAKQKKAETSKTNISQCIVEDTTASLFGNSRNPRGGARGGKRPARR